MRKQSGARMKLVNLEVENTDSDCVGSEPAYAGDRIVGLTTSGGFGHAVNKSLAFAYVEPKLATTGTEFEVLVLNQRRPARTIAEPAWDAENSRLRS